MFSTVKKSLHSAVKTEEVILTIHAPLTREQIAEATRLFSTVVVPVLAQEHRNDATVDDRDGAYLNVRNPENEEVLHTRSGEASGEEFNGYGDNARDKNQALHDNPNHQASWEVHRGDTTQKPYPGGIRSDCDDRIAISGFSWQRDTIGSLWIAYKLDRMVLSEALATAKLCGLLADFKRLFFAFQQAHQGTKVA